MFKSVVHFLAVFSIVLVGCETQFDFEEDDTGADQYIINGTVDDSGGPYFVTIFKTVQGLKNIPVTIRNACVSLLDENGNNEDFEFREGQNYRCNGDIIKVKPGAPYALKVEVDGLQFVSTYDIMPINKAPRHSMTWEQGKLPTTSELGIDSEEHVVYVNLQSEVPDTNENFYINWVGEEIYQFLQKRVVIPHTPAPPCYIIANYGGDRIKLLSSEEFSGAYREDKFLFRRIDDSFLRKHLISVFQYTISQDFYEYQSQIKILVENNGSLFDAPPGVALGNIHEVDEQATVHGFFRSVLVDTTTVAIYPSQLKGVMIRDACVYNFNIERCFDCPTTGKYSGFDRPEYYNRIN